MGKYVITSSLAVSAPKVFLNILFLPPSRSGAS